jgi:hypothetical protein
MIYIRKYTEYITEHKNTKLPKQLKGKRKVENIFGINRECTYGVVKLQDLNVIDIGMKTAMETFKTKPNFKISKKPIIVGVDINNGEKQLLDGYHRYFFYGGSGNHKALFIPMLDGKIISFNNIEQYITEHKKFKQLQNSNKSIIFKKKDLLQLVFSIIKVLPKDAIKELLNWDILVKSPYSYSFYNTVDIGWSHKEINSLRIANHWNFNVQNIRFDTTKIHCPTDIETKDKIWYLGQWNGDKYIILKEYGNIFYNNIEEISNQFPFLKGLAETNKESQIQYQKDVNSGLIKAIVYIDGNKIEGILTKSRGDRFVIDNDIILKKQSNQIGYKPFTIELYKNNELIKSETH